MKVVITHLKGAWPDGAKVGDLLEFEGAMPAWAVGKCMPAGAATTAPADLQHDGARAALIEMEVELAAERATVAELRAKLAEAETALMAQLQISASLNDKLAKATAAAPAKGGKG
jgi:hypothetical protein